MNTTQQTRFATALMDAMSKLGITVQQLAERSGSNARLFERFLASELVPGTKMTRFIAEQLNLEYEYLWGLVEEDLADFLRRRKSGRACAGGKSCATVPLELCWETGTE